MNKTILRSDADYGRRGAERSEVRTSHEIVLGRRSKELELLNGAAKPVTRAELTALLNQVPGFGDVSVVTVTSDTVLDSRLRDHARLAVKSKKQSTLRSEAREIKGDGGRLKLEDNFFQHPASNFQLPKVDKAVQRAVWRRVSGHLPEFEPLIVDAKWVRWGGLAFVGTVSEAPFHAVVADKIKDTDVIQLVQDYKRRFPKRIIFVAESVAEAQEKLLEQLALLGGTTERLWNIRGLTTPDSEENIFPEMIRELGRDQVLVIPRSEFRRIVERAGIEDWVKALSLERSLQQSA